MTAPGILIDFYSLDYEGKLNRINHSVPQRDSFFSIPLEQVDRWYEAMIQFVKMLNEEAVSFKTKPGFFQFIS